MEMLLFRFVIYKMLVRTNIVRYLILVFSVLLLFSCRKVFEPAKWEPELVFPIANTKLTIQNLISDTGQLRRDSSGLLRLVFNQKLDSVSLNVLKTFNAPPFNRNFKLDSLRLEVPTITQKFTLDSMASQLIKSGNTLNVLFGRELKRLDGKPLSASPFVNLLPSILTFPVGTVPISLNQFFESAEMRSGEMVITFTNRLPMRVTKLDYSIQNASDNSVIASEANLSIEKGASVVKTYDLTDKKIDGNLNVNLPSISLQTDRNAIIRLSDAIEVKIEFRNLQVKTAIAVFPDQDVITDKQAVALEDMGDLQLKEAVIDEGDIVLDVISTIQDSIFMTYTMPKTTLKGVPLVFMGVVPPAKPNSSTKIQLKVPVNDYNLNLSSPPDYYNRFLYEFKARVKYTGKKVNLNLNDSIVVNVYLNDVKPNYARGYLGKLDTTYGSVISTDIFSNLNAEKIVPEEVKLNFSVENGLGVVGNIQLVELKASNQSGASVQASDPDLIGKDIQIAAATDSPYKIATTVFKNGKSSNFPELVSIFPNKLAYKIQTKVGYIYDTNSFVYNNSKLLAQMQLEVPMKVSVQGLMLRDTLSINPTELQFETNGGALRISAYNGFPFNATLSAIFLSENGLENVVLTGNSPMLAADVDANTGKVLGEKYSKIELPFDNSLLYLVSKAKKVVLEARFDTPPNLKVKIYSDYSARLALIGRVNPKVSR